MYINIMVKFSGASRQFLSVFFSSNFQNIDGFRKEKKIPTAFGIHKIYEQNPLEKILFTSFTKTILRL